MFGLGIAATDVGLLRKVTRPASTELGMRRVSTFYQNEILLLENAMWPFFKPTLGQTMQDIYRRVDTSNEDAHLTCLRNLKANERAAWAVWILKCDVENGGFAQYFWNFEKEDFYIETNNGLSTIGATKHAALLSSALDLIKPHLEVMHTWHTHQDRFDKYKPLLQQTGILNQFLKLDGEFYDSKPSISSILSRFLNVKNDE